jgi:hypothetical protein
MELTGIDRVGTAHHRISRSHAAGLEVFTGGLAVCRHPQRMLQRINRRTVFAGPGKPFVRSGAVLVVGDAADSLAYRG